MKCIIIKTVLSVLLLSVAMPMVAQDETDKILEKYQKTANERDELSKRVKELEKQLKTDTTNIKSRYEKILEQQKKEYKKLEDKLKKDTTDLKKKSKQELDKQKSQYENQISELKKDTTAKGKTIQTLKSDLGKQANDKSQKAVDALKKELAELAKDTVKLYQQQRILEDKLAEVQKAVDAKEKELEQLRPFRKQMLGQMLADARQWAQLPFSELDPDKVAKLISDCREYGGGDLQFKDAASVVQQLQADLTQYNEAKDLLNRPYNEQSKNKARENLKQLLNKYAGKPQLAELKTVDELLRDYDGNVLLFQQLIADVDKEIEKERESGNKNGAKEMLKLALEDDDKKEVIASIKTVPYLAQLLDKYLKDLSNNPISHSSVEQEVKQMLPN